MDEKKRSVFRAGAYTVAMTLPKKWVEDNKIKTGDKVQFSIKGKNLILTK